MLLNNINYNDRHNRPVVLSNVGLQVNFLSDGQYVDPFEISAVTIFPRIANLYPETILNADTQLIDTSTVKDYILMNFYNPDSHTSSTDFNTSNYSNNLGGIYKISTGRYIVFLDGTNTDTEFGLINLDGLDQYTANKASSTGDYLDAWTIRMYEGSELQVVINEFTLRKGGFTVVTEPLMIKSKTRLINNKVSLGSKVNLKIATDLYVENTTIDESIKNLLRENVVTNASLEIQKLNEASNLPARVTVSSFADTSALVNISGDNVIMFNWDTSQLSTHPAVASGDFESVRGVYSIKAKYNIFDEIIVTDSMYLTLS